MNPITDKTAPSQTESISFEFDLQHMPEKVWRAITDPALVSQWLLPCTGLELQPGAAFQLKTQPYPGWDGTVDCRILEIERDGFGLRWDGLLGWGHLSIFSSSCSRRSTCSVQKAR